ncbi:MAG: ATP-binding protein [Pseudomonadota bacterium]
MALVVAGVCIALVSVPVLALLAMRLTSNQFVRETEQSLIHQAAIYAQVYADAFSRQGGPVIGTKLDSATSQVWAQALHPFRPKLNVRISTVHPALGALSPRADRANEDAGRPRDRRHRAIASDLLTLAQAAAKTTLAGAIFLDHEGYDILAPARWILSEQPEIRTALSGRVASVLRNRGDAYQRHPFASLSRDTAYRVFIAYPVIVKDHVVGVVYLSRTPSNLGKFLFQERYALGVMLIATLVTALTLGLVLLRLILRPVRNLSRQGHQIAAGELDEPTPLTHYGIRELADLGDNVMRMAQALKQRSRAIAVYTDHVTHELKSPITAIIGAGELLQAPELTKDARKTLEQNVLDQGMRMNALLERLRELTRLRTMPPSGPARLGDMLPEIEGLHIVLDTEPEAFVPISLEHGEMILHHMARNAKDHDATTMSLSLEQNTLTIRDDGTGIPDENTGQITDPFFTTRRDKGGTGMGLAIVVAILEIYSARLDVMSAVQGARFQICFDTEHMP